MIAELVDVHDIDRVWPLVSVGVINCLKKAPSYFTAADVWTMCRTGEAFLIVVTDGDFIRCASIWRFENGKFSCLVLVGKDSPAWMPALLERAIQIARDGGASALVASGRIGLGALLKKHLPSARVIRHTFEAGI